MALGQYKYACNTHWLKLMECPVYDGKIASFSYHVHFGFQFRNKIDRPS